MNKTTTPAELGKAAFKNGMPRVPAFDHTLFAEYLTGAMVGDKETARAMKQWLNGWDQAALRA